MCIHNSDMQAAGQVVFISRLKPPGLEAIKVIIVIVSNDEL